jgi:hypothetical protein
METGNSSSQLMGMPIMHIPLMMFELDEKDRPTSGWSDCKVTERF